MREIERYRVELSSCTHCQYQPQENWFSHSQLNLELICEACEIGISRVTAIIQQLTIQVDKGRWYKDEQVSARHAN